jgi:hypothetical protein
MADEVPREIHVGFRMLIEFIVQGVRLTREIESDNPAELVPEVRTEDGVLWERYRADNNDYFEVRQEYIYARTMEPIMEPNPLFEMLGDPDADPATAGPFRPPEAADLEARGER